MTAVLEHPAIAPADALAPAQWRNPENGLWVAADGIAYRGMIELRGDFYVASGPDNRHLGTFRTLNQAKRSVDPIRGTGPLADPDDRADLAGAIAASITGALALAVAIAGVVNLVG
jgi:hypothetical protein